MNYKYLTLPIFLLVALLFTFSRAAPVNIQNKCNYTVWAAAVPGGGQRLDPGQNWTVNATAGPARIWARTGCSFDGAGRGKCQTGDCNGLLQCRSFGSPPNTIAEFAFNQFDGSDFFDTSLVDGFNVPMILSPSSGGCNRSTGCTADINRDCPNELRAPGGCNNPCTVFKTNEYCCFSGPCSPTNYSQFFKDRCPESYNYPSDDQTSTLRCPSGTNYKVVFCP